MVNVNIASTYHSLGRLNPTKHEWEPFLQWHTLTTWPFFASDRLTRFIGIKGTLVDDWIRFHSHQSEFRFGFGPHAICYPFRAHHINGYWVVAFTPRVVKGKVSINRKIKGKQQKDRYFKQSITTLGIGILWQGIIFVLLLPGTLM